MKFVLHASAFEAEGHALRKLDRIFDRVSDRVHEVELPDVDFLRESRWFLGARHTARKFLMSLSSRPPRVASSDSTGKVLEVADESQIEVAEKLAHTPLTILVEDREADGVLLDIVVEEIGSLAIREIWNIKTAPRAVVIETAGGIGSMPERVRRLIDNAVQEARPVRLIALCDSDSRWPADVGSDGAKAVDNLRRICSEQQIPLHVLSKRTAENYIPDEVLVGYGSQNPAIADRVQALLRRSQVQRDHFPIKDGLSDDEREKGLQCSHFSEFDLPDLLLLKERIFPKRPRPFKTIVGGYRSLFCVSGIGRRDLDGELSKVLELIAGEL